MAYRFKNQLDARMTARLNRITTVDPRGHRIFAVEFSDRPVGNERRGNSGGTQSVGLCVCVCRNGANCHRLLVVFRLATVDLREPVHGGFLFEQEETEVREKNLFSVSSVVL